MALTKVTYTDDVTVIEAQNLNDIQDAIIRIDPADNTGKSIPENADLNSYSTPGHYYCDSSAKAATLTNSPTTAAFVLEVYSRGTYRNQVLYAGKRIYLRTSGSNGWNTWYSTASLEGDNFTGEITVDRANGTVGASGWSGVKIGNNKDLSVAGNSAGYLRIYGTTAYYGDIGYATNNPTAIRQYKLPNADGTLALDLSASFTGTAMTGGTLNRCTGTIGEKPSIFTNGREYYIYGRLTVTSFVRTGSNPYIEFQTSFRPSHNLYGDTGIRFDADVAKPEKIAVNLSTAGVLTISNTETHFNMPSNARVVWLFPMLALL